MLAFDTDTLTDLHSKAVFTRSIYLSSFTIDYLYE